MIADLITGSVILIGMSGMFVAFVISQSRKLNPHDPRWCKHENDWTYTFDEDNHEDGYTMCDDCGKVMDHASL